MTDESKSFEHKEEVKKSAPSKEKGSKKAPSHRSMPENIEGISLTNPNYFQKRLERADPILFLKKKQGKFKQYSRSCAVNIRRQPVLLTEEEFAFQVLLTEKMQKCCLLNCMQKNAFFLQKVANSAKITRKR